MNGQQILNTLAGLLGSEVIDPVVGLSLVNVARVIFQEDRPWEILKKTDDSVTVPAGLNPNNPLTIPADFARFIDDKNEIILSNGTTINYRLRQAPLESKLLYQNQFGWFVMDEANGVFYILGQVPQQLTVYFNYISDPGDITLTTQWGNFPVRFHKILPPICAAMYRLGVDYDSLNARNAADNELRANKLFTAMVNWDTNLALAAVQQTDPAAKYHGRRTFGGRSNYNDSQLS